MKKLSLLLTAVLCLSIQLFSENTEKPVTIGGTVVHTLTSTNTGKDYELHISLPGGYSENPEQDYRVMYFLDAQWDFPMVHQVYGGLNYDRLIGDCILVGITYGGENPNYDALRSQDYTTAASNHPPEMNPNGGGAEKFYQFIAKEVIPYVESNYRASAEKRILGGVSYGGLFTLYTLVMHGETFDDYIASTPAVISAGGDWFAKEASVVSKTQNPARVYISVGGTEHLEYKSNVYRAAGILSGPDYNLDVRLKEVVGLGHSSQRAETWALAMSWMLSL